MAWVPKSLVKELFLAPFGGEKAVRFASSTARQTLSLALVFWFVFQGSAGMVAGRVIAPCYTSSVTLCPYSPLLA